ncbi:MAG: YjiH family protein, partial [Chlamydiota bacterium]
PTKETNILSEAWHVAMKKAERAPSFTKSLSSGLLEGLFLSFTILGTILFIGTVALLVVKHTNLLDLLGAPLVPLLELLNIPDAKMVAPAVVAGASEMYLPALMTKGAEVKAKFFVAVLSISQLIFFSSCAPMMMTMFPTVPITFLHLIYLFALRTMILIPLIALIAQLMEWLSYF